jgi:hypothetical protein
MITNINQYVSDLKLPECLINRLAFCRHSLSSSISSKNIVQIKDLKITQSKLPLKSSAAISSFKTGSGEKVSSEQILAFIDKRE